MKQVIVVESIIEEVYYVDSDEDVDLETLQSLDCFSNHMKDSKVVRRMNVPDFPYNEKPNSMNASTWHKKDGEWVEQVRWDLRERNDY